MTLPPRALLGWIKPDDGVRGLDYECYRLDRWLSTRGAMIVRVAVETSIAENGHGVNELLGTGDASRLNGPARRLADAGVGAICWACTSGSFVGGLEWAQAQARVLATTTGVPATSASLALADGVRAIGADTIDLLSPYPAGLTDILCGFFWACGIRVRGVKALECAAGSDSNRLDLRSAVASFAAARLAGGVPLVIPDSAINTLDVIAAMENELARPVVTANQATLWKGLRLLGVEARIPGGGVLLAGIG